MILVILTSFSVGQEKSTAINLNNFILFNSIGPQLNSFIARVYTKFTDSGSTNQNRLVPDKSRTSSDQDRSVRRSKSRKSNYFLENPRKSFDGTPYYRHNLNRFIQENEIYKNKGHFQNVKIT